VVSSTPPPLYPPGKTRYSLYRRQGGPQGRSGRAENLAPTGIRSSDRPARSQSLYRLSYLAHHIQRAPGFSPVVKRPGRGFNHSPPSRTEAKERVKPFVYFPTVPTWQGEINLHLHLHSQVVSTSRGDN
jgi:hypothetical protein